MTYVENKEVASRIVKVTVGFSKYLVEGTAIQTKGNGMVVCILGGEAPHVGAVAIAIPRPSLKDPKRLSATSSVFTLVGHKDDQIAKPIAEKIAKKFNQVTVVTAGVHVDKASKQDVKKLVENSTKIAEKLIIRLKKCAA